MTMSNDTMRILAIVIFLSAFGAASAIRKGSTWTSPFVYGDTLKCGIVKQKLSKVAEEGKDHHKVTYLYLSVSFPKGQEDVCVTDKCYASSEIGKEICFKKDLYIGAFEGMSLVVLFAATLILMVGIILKAID